MVDVYPDRPGHNSVDTSIEAADDIAPDLGRLQHLVETAIRSAGARGLTADELAAQLRIDRLSIRPRASELRRKGIIRDSGQRRRNDVSGKRAIVWVSKGAVPDA